jgi:hypothetical protein
VLVFITFAVAPILIVTGLRPHENRMIPPARTAATTEADVQLAAVPCPTIWVACDVSTGPASAGTGTERTPASGVRMTEPAAGTTVAPTTTTQKQQKTNGVDRRITRA